MLEVACRALAGPGPVHTSLMSPVAWMGWELPVGGDEGRTLREHLGDEQAVERIL